MSHRKEKRARRSYCAFNTGMLTALTFEALMLAPQAVRAAVPVQKATSARTTARAFAHQTLLARNSTRRFAGGKMTALASGAGGASAVAGASAGSGARSSSA